MSSIFYPCILCATLTSLWCSRCQGTFYCCSEHLRMDWPRHRAQCIPVSQFAYPGPSEEAHITVTGILYPPDEARPRFVEIGLRQAPFKSAHDTPECPIPLLQPYFGDEHPQNLILAKGLNGIEIRFPLQIWYSPMAFQTMFPINRAVQHATGVPNAKPWYGPVIVLKFRSSKKAGFTDAGTRDFTALLDYFLSETY
ncbi:hypothetical protein K435DRAFT_864320 [Dendrothele bispora CBS 962.96]|uniref:MYND-type domain-containing protein n=1 Tax=Dendrothele bispora (strain CBS 962.96) TaxID=1314807 RepID=A0A4S8LMB7_DENBC|nr:hypothetical protein K435DRAFT_864320 [Dendrothele bispora CBS 962.96]